MNGQSQTNGDDLASKVARLVQERGWNQGEFARRTGLGQHTVRSILQGGAARRLRNDTIGRCAKALGLTVHELCTAPLERLLLRANHSAGAPPSVQHLYDLATQPELRIWLEHHPDRANQFSREEIDELLSLQGTGGPLTRAGVEHYVRQLERRRQLQERVQVLANTDYLELLEQLVDLLYDKVQPYKDRK